MPPQALTTSNQVEGSGTAEVPAAAGGNSSSQFLAIAFKISVQLYIYTGLRDRAAAP